MELCIRNPSFSLDVIVLEIFTSELPMNFQSLKVGMVKSDLCRLVMLYNIGGLYFDTDSNVGEMMWLYVSKLGRYGKDDARTP